MTFFNTKFLKKEVRAYNEICFRGAQNVDHFVQHNFGTV